MKDKLGKLTTYDKEFDGVKLIESYLKTWKVDSSTTLTLAKLKKHDKEIDGWDNNAWKHEK